MTDQELADELIERMNRVIRESEAARDAVSRLIQERIPAQPGLGPHPTIQVELRGEEVYVGFLGILNGTIGAIPEGDKRGWGYVCARFDSEPDGTLVLVDFQRTDQ